MDKGVVKVESTSKSDAWMLKQIFLTDPETGERLFIASSPSVMAENKNFLDSDHLISLDLAVKILNREIQWCHQNDLPDKVSADYRQGFIKGIEQSKSLVIKMAETEFEVLEGGSCSFEVANKHNSRRWKITFRLEEV